jgi:hypothetical protein
LGSEEGEGWMAAPGSSASDPNLQKQNGTVTASPLPTQYFNKVERSRSHTQEMSEVGSASSSSGRIRVDTEVRLEGSNEEIPKQPSKSKGMNASKQTQGMRKNVWEVRKK